MLFIVDGTGPWLTDEYNSEMRGSFCRQLETEFRDRCRYWRGPSLLGIEISNIVDLMCREIRRLPAKEPIFLCGYSRGGTAAIVAARNISPRPIKAIFLFDAVDRALVMSLNKISGNVQSVYHARRDRSFARKFEAAAREARIPLSKANAALQTADSGNRLRAALFGGDHKATLDVRNKINSLAIVQNQDRDLKWKTRNVEGLSPANFDNVGLAVVLPGRYETAQFAGSHGALGGVPWPDADVPGDCNAVPLVRNWMWARMRREGVQSLR